MQGSQATQNINACRVLQNIIDDVQWMNVHTLPHDIYVFEVLELVFLKYTYIILFVLKVLFLLFCQLTVNLMLIYLNRFEIQKVMVQDGTLFLFFIFFFYKNIRKL